MNVETNNVVVSLSTKSLKHKIYNAFCINKRLRVFTEYG